MPLLSDQLWHPVWEKSRSACLLSLDLSSVLPSMRLSSVFWLSHICSIACISREGSQEGESLLQWPGARGQFGTSIGFSGFPFQAHSELYSEAGTLLQCAWMPFVGAGECLFVVTIWQWDIVLVKSSWFFACIMAEIRCFLCWAVSLHPN